MFVPKRVLLAVLALAAAALALVVVSGAFADHGDGKRDGEGAKLFRSTLAPSVPTDPAFHGRTPGGVPWVLRRGEVRIKASGEFDLRLDGLVIPTLGTAGPVTTVSASLFCGADADAAPAATTQAVPLSQSGDARIHERLALPAQCLAPIVLVHPNGINARYIAVSGWKS